MFQIQGHVIEFVSLIDNQCSALLHYVVQKLIVSSNYLWLFISCAHGFIVNDISASLLILYLQCSTSTCVVCVTNTSNIASCMTYVAESTMDASIYCFGLNYKRSTMQVKVLKWTIFCAYTGTTLLTTDSYSKIICIKTKDPTIERVRFMLYML